MLCAADVPSRTRARDSRSTPANADELRGREFRAQFTSRSRPLIQAPVIRIDPIAVLHGHVAAAFGAEQLAHLQRQVAPAFVALCSVALRRCDVRRQTRLVILRLRSRIAWTVGLTSLLIRGRRFLALAVRLGLLAAGLVGSWLARARLRSLLIER